MNSGTTWDPQILKEIRDIYKHTRVTMTDLAEKYGTSPSTVHNIVHERGRFNPKFTGDPAKVATYHLLGHSAAWYHEKFLAQHLEVDPDEVSNDPDSTLPRLRPETHRLSQPYDWYFITDVTGDERTAEALATLCNNLYFRLHRTEITRMKNIRRDEEYRSVCMNSKRNMAVAYLAEVYNLVDDFFAMVMDVEPGTTRVWKRMGVGALVDI